MTRETRATCTRALYDRLDFLERDVRDNGDFYDRTTWRGQVHRKNAAREIVAIRRALAELRFVDWAKGDGSDAFLDWQDREAERAREVA